MATAPVPASVGAQGYGTTSAAIGVPSGVASGSKVVVFHFAYTNTTTAITTAAITAAPGFVSPPGASYGGVFGGLGYWLFSWWWKDATAADSGTYTFTTAGAGGSGGYAMRITGATGVGVSPFVDTVHGFITSSSGSAPIASFTPGGDGTLCLAGVIGGATFTATGWTSVAQAIDSDGDDLGVLSFSQATAAAIAPTFTSSSYAGVSIASLRGVVEVDATVTPTAATQTVTTPAPTLSTSGDANVAPSAATQTVTTPAPTVTGTSSPTITPPAASATGATPAPTVTTTGPTLTGETSRTSGTTANGTAYSKVVGTLGSDGYVAYLPAGATSNIDLLIWNHPFDSPYDADIAGTGDSGWTFALTSWLLDHGIAIASSNDAGDQWGNAAVMTAIDNLYAAINTTLGIGRLVVYGESMGGAATLNWTARHNTAPLVGAMTISGVCDTRLFSSFSPPPTGGSTYDPMEQAASGWAGLPIFMASSPSDTVVSESANTNAFITHLGGVATLTHVEGTGDHLTSGNYPVAAMETWLSARFATASNATVTPTAASESATAPAPGIEVDAAATPSAAGATVTTPAPTVVEGVVVDAPVATQAASAPAPSVAATQNPTITPTAASETTRVPAPTIGDGTTATTGPAARGALELVGISVGAIDVEAISVGATQIWP